MKQTLLALVLVVIPAASFAGGPTHSYLVGTRHRAPEAIRQLAREDAGFLARRTVDAFDIVDAFRADLTDDEVAALQKSPEVRYVEADVLRHAYGVPSHAAANELRNPNGQTIPLGVKMVNAEELWPTTRGNLINVAVLDTGIDVNHPDLQAAYAGGLNTFFGDSKYPGEPQAPIDDEGHGTHVAGTIAASDNNIGVVGVAPGVRLWAVRVLRSDGSGSATGPAAKIVQGIQWVIQQKAAKGGDWIISMSLGSCQSASTEASAISSAINAGVLVVAAAGNHDPTQPSACTADNNNAYSVSFPAAYPGVIAVAAVDSTKTVADFSNFGPEVAIAAPGVNVLSTVPLGTGSISFVTTSSGTTLESVPLTGSPRGTLTGTFVDCGLGKTASDFPASVSGNIALIKRGDVSFAIKVKNAQAAGAAAVIIYNKDNSDLGFTLTADPADAGHAWPLSVAVSLKDGQTLLAQAAKSVTIADTADDYDNFNGTSMATPHVAGVAALVWSVSPGVTAATVRQALLASAHDLGDPGFDTAYGNGFVDAFAAARQLNPSIPIPVLGRAPGRRGH
jgi:serine protease